jgi:Pentapeptide repeats (8 copies)
LKERSLLVIYKKLIDIDYNELFTFLTVSKEVLLRIDNIERYLMVSDPIGMTNKLKRPLDVDSRKQLNLLRNRQVTEFNKYLEQRIPIHLPFEKFSGSDLHQFRLAGSLLFMSDLSGADLFKADLINANLSGANSSHAIIIGGRYSRVVVNTDFSNAIIDSPDFLKYLREKGCKKIPNEIKNKQELRKHDMTGSRVNIQTLILTLLYSGESAIKLNS